MPPKLEEESAAEPHYTVFIKLPFPRGDFIDPPAVSVRIEHEELWLKYIGTLGLFERSCFMENSIIID